MIQAVLDQFRMTYRLMTDPRVPLWTKAIPVLAILYVISPVDLIPDFIPGLGQLDDLGVLLAAMRLMESMTPGEIVRYYRGEVVSEKKKRG